MNLQELVPPQSAKQKELLTQKPSLSFRNCPFWHVIDSYLKNGDEILKENGVPFHVSLFVNVSLTILSLHVTTMSWAMLSDIQNDSKQIIPIK